MQTQRATCLTVTNWSGRYTGRYLEETRNFGRVIRVRQRRTRVGQMVRRAGSRSPNAQRALVASARSRALEAAAAYETAAAAAEEQENSPPAARIYRAEPIDVSAALSQMLQNVPDAPSLLYDGSILPRDMITLQQQLLCMNPQRESLRITDQYTAV